MAVVVVPGHITAIYIFAVLNLMALFHISLVEADILVMDTKTNVTRRTILDMPAQFGPRFEAPPDGTRGHLIYANPPDGCKKFNHSAPLRDGPWILLIRRGGGCNFDQKVFNAQRANYVAAIVHNIDDETLIPMGRSADHLDIQIPSCFIGSGDAEVLRQYNGSTDFWVLIDSRAPFNFNISYLIPFAIVVGICFILMIVFMIARWVLDYRKRRRSRLSKDALKKIPIKKFKKGDHYDVCAICLDEYEEGEKLRILPCSHAYHMKCIDPWLTKSKRNCPVCKRRVIPGDDSESDSDSDGESEGQGENTPLLTAGAGSTNSRPHDHYPRSGLPGVLRGTVTHSSSDSDQDSTDSSMTGSYQNQVAQVHGSPRHGGGYGATANVAVVNETNNAGNSASSSRASSVQSREGYECLAGAVGGADTDIPQVDFVDDHYCADTEMSGLVSNRETSDDNEDDTPLVRVMGKKSPKKSPKNSPTGRSKDFAKTSPKNSPKISPKNSPKNSPRNSPRNDEIA